jgi:hypothetical protein
VTQKSGIQHRRRSQRRIWGRELAPSRRQPPTGGTDGIQPVAGSTTTPRWCRPAHARAAVLQQCCSASHPQQSSTGDTDGRYLGVKIIAALLAQCRNPAHNIELSSGRKSPKHRPFQPTSKSKTRGESHVYPPQKFMMATFSAKCRGLLSHQLDRQCPHLSITPLVPAPTALLPEPLASRTCAEGHVRDDFRRVVRPATVILGPKACMRVILVKSGKPGDRLPIWVCQAAPGETGDLLNCCAPATSRR